ncbi:MAG: hypothetical protein Q9M92_14105 [Enterobacterales bacterium]|nr:hypothetical protein [Enterobacterales bacterium]
MPVFFDELSSVVEAKLFFKESSGYCVPTNETYLISYAKDDYPTILASIDGHTPSIEVATIDGIEFLFLYYFAGGNQYILEIYTAKEGVLIKVSDLIIASNIRSIELTDDTILVKNQRLSATGKQEIESSLIRFRNNVFTRERIIGTEK